MDLGPRRELKEDRLHGSDLFPLAAYWIERPYNDGPVLDCHWHSEAEFFVVLEGEVLFQVDTDYFTVKAGEAVFIDGGDIHAGHPSGQAPCTYCAIVFDTALLASSTYDLLQQKFVKPLQDKTRTFPRHIKPDSDWERSLLQGLGNIMKEFEGGEDGYEAAIKGTLLLMLREIAPEGRHANRSETAASDSAKIDRLKNVIGYMHRNYHRPVRIAELARQIPMSEGQFCRFFKGMTRQTPIEYLNAFRIRKAAELLLRPDSKISNVAMDVGFDHISYFVKVFRSIMKCTPSEFRKKSMQHFEP